MKLSRTAAEAAMTDHIGTILSIDNTTAAYGVTEIVDENMSNAARMHAVENGKELSDFRMIAFGGAAPLHAARLCEKLGIVDLIIPPGAGVGSAIGFLRAPFGFESVRSSHVRLDNFDVDMVNTVIRELVDEATFFVRSGAPDVTPTLECTAYMRYVGQGWEVPVTIEVRDYSSNDEANFRSMFAVEYARFFGRVIDGLDAEIVSWSLRASSPAETPVRIELVSVQNEATPRASRQLFDAASGRHGEAKIVDRALMTAGDWIAGPAIITERETSTIVPESRTAIMQPDGCLLLRATKSL